jgi:hypothetical protein
VRPLALFLAASTALVASLPAPAARACAPAPRPGEIVRITNEAALIVWDPKTRTEHFIRSASFATTAKDFGFLVPTPSKPELSEVNSDLLQSLARHTAPRHVNRISGVDVEPGCTAMMFLGRSAPETAAASAIEPASVRVLEEKRVAGHDAVVLEADSATALSDWLKEHGYAEGPTLTDWLRPYVAAKWKISAFKIASDAPAQALSTSAVRMTFTTDRPFYPYREPADQRETVQANLPADPGNRTLRVFFLAPGRFDGAVGEAGLPWPGKPRWSSHLPPASGPSRCPRARGSPISRTVPRLVPAPTMSSSPLRRTPRRSSPRRSCTPPR